MWPVILSLLLLGASGEKRPGRPVVVALVGSTLFVGFTILLTLSLSALLGTLVGVLMLGVLLRRRETLVIAGMCGVLVVVAVVGVTLVRPSAIAETLLAAYTTHLQLRIELWQRAFFILEDFPLTGIGINTLPVVLGNLYPLVLASGDPRPPPHVHNLFLQTGVDLGVPGLLAFFWLLGLAARMLRRTWRAGGITERYLAAGLAAGLSAHLVFGLTDAVALGARPGFLLWWVLGLCEATHYSVEQSEC
jgi:putative inorganic carbon (HCO3(-)) transporter